MEEKCNLYGCTKVTLLRARSINVMKSAYIYCGERGWTLCKNMSLHETGGDHNHSCYYNLPPSFSTSAAITSASSWNLLLHGIVLALGGERMKKKVGD